jgi:hypothetical protein
VVPSLGGHFVLAEVQNIDNFTSCEENVALQADILFVQQTLTLNMDSAQVIAEITDARLQCDVNST